MARESKQFFKELKRPSNINPRLETGFSMLEAVVVVGVLLALAIGGFFAFGPITENAKRSKVKSAASQVHTGVTVAAMDGDGATQPENVIDDWNAATDKIRVVITSQSDSGDYCITATDVNNPNITAQSGDCSGGNGTLPSDGSVVPDGESPTVDTSARMTTVFATGVHPPVYSDPVQCTEITLPLNGEVNATVNWGDGSPPEVVTSPNPTYTYPETAAEYTITIDGTFTKWAGSEWSNECITKVTSWGDGTGTTDIASGFAETIKLNEVARIPSNITDLSYLFYYSDFTGAGVENWDVSNVTTLSNAFEGAWVFDGDVSGWDTSNVTDMSRAFSGAEIFNQDIGNWNTSNVTNMTQLFFGVGSFNHDLSSWDTSKVTTMASLFDGAAMFNQDISGWNTSNVTNMQRMFNHAVAFDYDVVGWDTSKVTDMQQMFANTVYNRPLTTTAGGWNTSNVTTMSSMFGENTAFDQDISSWDTSKVKNMSYMFYGATSFNQDIGNWNVAQVGYLADGEGWWNQGSFNSMFYGATSFNQDLTGWPVRSGVPHIEFNVNSGLPDSKTPIWK